MIRACLGGAGRVYPQRWIFPRLSLCERRLARMIWQHLPMYTQVGVHIRPFVETGSVDELTALLHRAYAELGAQGLRFTAVDQSEAKTHERIAKGRCFVAVMDSALVGTVTYYPPGANLDSAWYHQPGVAVFGQFGVDPAQRGKRIGTSLLNHVQGPTVQRNWRWTPPKTRSHWSKCIRRWDFESSIATITSSQRITVW